METLKELFAKIFNVPKDKITEDSSPENISSWDSFNGLMLVSELETNFKVHFSIDEIMAVKKFSDIKKALKKHGVSDGVDD